jgi:cyclic pyranopterin phosphate synthase
MRVFRDGFGRVHDDLRISVTDRCNLRCGYCMPVEPTWFPRAEILSYEEVLRLVRIAIRRGVRKLRLTGGEPLVRRDLPALIGMLAEEPGVEDLSLTTNGALLASQAVDLATAGLQRINVSLDTLDPERYLRMTRRDLLGQVLKGLRAAAAVGISPIKINAVLMRGVNDDEAETLVEQARLNGWQLRFIEFMPLENGKRWEMSKVVTGEEVRRRIQARWPIERDKAQDPHAPATRYHFGEGGGALGFIDSVSEPFCASCSRLRLTADGQFRVCLYDQNELDLKTPMRAGATDVKLERLMERAVHGKGPGGALEILQRRKALPLTRTMHQIGG